MRVTSVLRLSWIFLILYCEIGVWFYLHHCSWPDEHLDPSASATHLLLVADPQILDHRSYPERGPVLTYLSRVFTDLNLRKNWRAALRTRPDHVIFVGDLMDSGRRVEINDEEYESYFNRFCSIFGLHPSTPRYFVPGNHDTGLGVSPLFSPHADSRYIAHFGPLNRVLTIANHTFFFLDAPSLVEEDDLRRVQGKSFTDWIPPDNGPTDFVKKHSAAGVVLITHIPLGRPDGTLCGPLREKGTIRRGRGIGYQNTLSDEATAFLLQSLRPIAIFSGDDHDYCELVHRLPESNFQVREVSLKSISMAMGIRRPGFQLFSLTAARSRFEHADRPCFLPDQIGIYLVSNASNMRCPTSRRRSAFKPPLTPGPSGTVDEDGRTSSIPLLRFTGSLLRSRSESDHDLDDLEEVLTVEPLLPSPLPYPVSANVSEAHSFMMFGKRYRMANLPWLSIRCPMPVILTVKGRRRSGGYVQRVLADICDVAIYPIGIFAVISWWTLTG